MADYLVVRGYTHIEKHEGDELKWIPPTNGKSHHTLPRFWQKGRKAIYAPCVILEMQNGLRIYIFGDRTMRLSVGVNDHGELSFGGLHGNTPHLSRSIVEGVDRILVTGDYNGVRAGIDDDYDEYIPRWNDTLYKVSHGTGAPVATHAAPAQAPPAPAATAPVTPPATYTIGKVHVTRVDAKTGLPVLNQHNLETKKAQTFRITWDGTLPQGDADTQIKWESFEFRGSMPPTAAGATSFTGIYQSSDADQVKVTITHPKATDSPQEGHLELTSYTQIVPNVEIQAPDTAKVNEQVTFSLINNSGHRPHNLRWTDPANPGAFTNTEENYNPTFQQAGTYLIQLKFDGPVPAGGGNPIPGVAGHVITITN